MDSQRAKNGGLPYPSGSSPNLAGADPTRQTPTRQTNLSQYGYEMSEAGEIWAPRPAGSISACQSVCPYSLLRHPSPEPNHARCGSSVLGTLNYILFEPHSLGTKVPSLV